MENKIYNYYRLFGWSIIATVFAFLVNNVMQLSFGFESIFSLENKFSITSVIELIIYFFSLIISLIVMLKLNNKPLRFDSKILHNFNVYIIRSCFWVIFLVGLVDITISFLRVEKLFELFLSKELLARIPFDKSCFRS